MNPAIIASSLTPQERKAIGIGSAILLIGTAYLGYRIYRNIKRTKADDVSKEMTANLRNVKIQKNNVTLKSGEAELIAQQIFDAMNRRGTDFDTILRNLISLRTRDDLLYVIRAFGIKNYGITGEADSWLARKTGYATPLNMSGWLLKELDSNEIEKVKEIYRKFDVPF
jgi:hypothetical protein